MPRHKSPWASDRPTWGGGSFAEQLTANRQFKDDNKDRAMPVKVALRREAMEAVGPAPARVLDCFAGKGRLWAEVWRSAAGYVGCDEKIDQVIHHPSPGVFCMEAQQLLRLHDLNRFNVFDLDAYGSPWQEATILAARRRLQPGETIAVCVTDGSVRRASLGLTAFALADLAGMDPRAAGAHQRWTEIVRAALMEMARRMGGELASLRQTGRSHFFQGVFYGCGVLRGRPPTAAPATRARKAAPRRPRRAAQAPSETMAPAAPPGGPAPDPLPAPGAAPG